MSDHKAANRFEEILASDVRGIPVALILCVVAAMVLERDSFKLVHIQS